MKVKVKDKYMSKFNDSVYEVYGVKNNANGYPCFLIYEKNQWHYYSAKFFIPYQIDFTYTAPTPFGIYNDGNISYSNHT